jgi:hypothetical protein
MANDEPHCSLQMLVLKRLRKGQETAADVLTTSIAMLERYCEGVAFIESTP